VATTYRGTLGLAVVTYSAKLGFYETNKNEKYVLLISMLNPPQSHIREGKILWMKIRLFGMKRSLKK
jgi:hypothetical protein